MPELKLLRCQLAFMLIVLPNYHEKHTKMINFQKGENRFFPAKLSVSNAFVIQLSSTKQHSI